MVVMATAEPFGMDGTSGSGHSRRALWGAYAQSSVHRRDGFVAMKLQLPQTLDDILAAPYDGTTSTRI